MDARVLKDNEQNETHDETIEERENNGAEMSDEREMNDQMREEYESGKSGPESKIEKRERLNNEERERTEGSLKNKTQV